MVTKVLFLTGWLRSGTTVLGNALGSSPRIEHIGELHYLWDRNHPSNGECGCSKPLTICPVWGRVLTDAQKRGIDRYTVNATRLAHWRMRKLPQRLWELRHAEVPRQYPDLLGDIYHDVALHADVDLVVDSTKLPGDAFAAAMARDTDTYFLHVVRDPRASSYSSLRKKRHGKLGNGPLMRKHGPVSNSARWLAFNSAADLVIRRAAEAGRFRELRYEDLVRDPHRTLRILCDWIQISSDSLPLVGDRGIELTTTHTVMGNPNRFRTGTLELTPDSEWETAFTGLPRALSTAASIPLLHHYNYKWIVGGNSAA